MSDFADATLSLCRSGTDFTCRQFGILILCQRRAGAPDDRQVQALATELSIPKASVTRAVDRLSEKGLVRRVVPATDRRRCIIEITPAGRRFMESLAA